jgi:hypothetical protein
MHYRFYQLLLVLAVSLMASSISYAQTPIATIVSYKGPVLIKSKKSGKWDSTTMSLRLAEGDSVKLGKKSKATVLYLNGKETRLTSGEIYRVATEKKNHINKKLASVLEWLFQNTDPSHYRGAPETPFKKLLLSHKGFISYQNSGKILSNRPSFTWLAFTPKKKDSIKLLSNNSRIVWETVLEDSLFIYPPTEPNLIDGETYSIEIERSGRKALEICSVVTAEERQSIVILIEEIQTTYNPDDPDDVIAYIVRAALLMQQSFFIDAQIILEQALKKQPENLTIKIMLSEIY